MKTMNKKAAMEMSVGTIVTIVLLMSVLVLGLVLTKGIFTSATGAIKMTDAQLKKQISKIYGEETRLGIYPESRSLELKQGQEEEVGVVIKNLLEDLPLATSFTYIVSVDPVNNKCPLNEAGVMNFIKIGEQGSKTLAPGDTAISRVRFDIPSTAPLCTVRYSVSVEFMGEGGLQSYAEDDFDVEIVAK